MLFILPSEFCHNKIFIEVGKLLCFFPEITTAAVDLKQEIYLLCPAETHPHFESSEEQFNHLIVLEIHSWTV